MHSAGTSCLGQGLRSRMGLCPCMQPSSDFAAHLLCGPLLGTLPREACAGPMLALPGLLPAPAGPPGEPAAPRRMPLGGRPAAAAAAPSSSDLLPSLYPETTKLLHACQVWCSAACASGLRQTRWPMGKILVKKRCCCNEPNQLWLCCAAVGLNSPADMGWCTLCHRMSDNAEAVIQQGRAWG